MSKTLYVTIQSTGRIPLIGGNGPILVPTPMGDGLVKKLVMNGVHVTEHNPKDFRQTKRVTRNNINEDRFPPEVPKPVEFPVGKEVPTVSLGKPNVILPKESSVAKDVPVEEETSVESVEIADASVKEHVTPAIENTNPVDRYAGLSKNQRKRLKQQEAAARAAQQANTQENTSAE